MGVQGKKGSITFNLDFTIILSPRSVLPSFSLCNVTQYSSSLFVMTTKADEAVACPNCSAQINYTALNTHLDDCLGLKANKRQSDNKDREAGRGSAVKRSKVELHNGVGSRPIQMTPQPASHSIPSTTSNNAASTSRERLDSVAPLAERLRPRTLDDFVGQDGVVNGPLKALLQRGTIPNAILWGPPGTGEYYEEDEVSSSLSSSHPLLIHSGKTTLARILARTAKTAAGPHRFVEISATTASTNDVKKIFDEAVNRLQLTGQRTVLFIDEIQRFSRAQQDIFLPVIEKGHCILLAATTENPSFRLQGALLSRMRVFVLTKLSVDECFQVLCRARRRIESESVKERKEEKDEEEDTIDDSMLRWIAEMADGDARTALSAFETALVTVQEGMSSEEKLASLRVNLKRTSLQYDRTGDHHYDTISALHKSIRGSNADAALYWLARMVESGDDPLFIARRLIVAASEDCNTLQALQMATATYSACQVVGLPECGENLAQCVVFLAESPKSTRAYRGWKKAQKLVRETYNYPVPIHIRNAPTKLMKELGYAKEYHYEPSFAHPVHQEYFPPELKQTRLLSPPPPESDQQQDNVNDTLSNGSQKAHQPPLMKKSAGVGPGSCQRIFTVGARSVDLDLLDEWEKERNEGRPWSGRATLMARMEPVSQV